MFQKTSLSGNQQQLLGIGTSTNLTVYNTSIYLYDVTSFTETGFNLPSSNTSMIYAFDAFQ